MKTAATAITHIREDCAPPAFTDGVCARITGCQRLTCAASGIIAPQHYYLLITSEMPTTPHAQAARDARIANLVKARAAYAAKIATQRRQQQKHTKRTA